MLVWKELACVNKPNVKAPTDVTCVVDTYLNLEQLIHGLKTERFSTMLYNVQWKEIFPRCSGKRIVL